jgi:cell division transport system permease protein
MRLVGATSAFIRKPFIRNNIITGFISGIIAIILLMASLYYVKVEFINPDDVIKSDTMLIIYGIVLISGIMLSVLAAYFSVNRYLRMSHRKLYYI